MWGVYDVRRSVIRSGVRFELTSCPNALQWTATVHPTDAGKVICHCTIDCTEHDPEFIESIRVFLHRFAEGISKPETGIC